MREQRRIDDAKLKAMKIKAKAKEAKLVAKKVQKLSKEKDKKIAEIKAKVSSEAGSQLSVAQSNGDFLPEGSLPVIKEISSTIKELQSLLDHRISQKRS